MTEEVERPDGPLLNTEQLPKWLRQFDLFLDVYDFDEAELLAECLFCDLALLMPKDFDPKANPETILELAQHGVEHAVDGHVRRASS